MKIALTLPLALAALATGGVALAQAAQQADPQARERPARAAAMTKEQAGAMADRAFERLDVNQDGTLSDADREAQQRAMFDRLDADSDGAISFAEFQSARGERREARAERGADAGAQARGARSAGRDRASGPRGMGRMARGADADENGEVSMDEFRTAALARFDAADADRDGSISPEERRGMRGRGMGRGMAPGMGRGMPPRSPAG